MAIVLVALSKLKTTSISQQVITQAQLIFQSNTDHRLLDADYK